MDPSRSAGKFYQALLRIPGWERMPVTVAAQAVQHSAFPDAYADDEVLARKLLGLASTQHAVSAGVSPGSGSCTAASAVLGTVTFPLPSGAPYVDRHNFGGHGSHWARMHTGTDLSVSCGTPVLAATAGRIVIRTDQSWAGRWLVQVSTGPGQLTTWYAHMQAVTVSTGQQVAAGQQIGEVGDLGNATGCHLHFEVHPHGGHIYQDPVDPSPWLRANVGRRSQTVAPADWASSAAAFTVATFNTLGSSHTEATGKKPRLASGVARTRGVIELLDKYGVDVVGLQEFQRPQQRAFRTQAGDTFATWAPSGDPENSIAWRRDRWDLVAVDSFSIPYFDGHPRRMPIVRLRDRSTGREALFVNVHNPADTRRYPHQARWRAAAVGREVTLVRRLERSTGIPVFLTGDLNDRRTGPCGLVGRASMTASNGAACTLPRAAGIDWILGSDAVQFGNHTADSSALVKATSDHPFVVTRARTAY